MPGFVIQDELAAIGHNQQDGMSGSVSLFNDRNQQGICRPTTLNEHAAFQQDKIFAISALFGWIGPPFRLVVQVGIFNRSDGRVDLGIDLLEITPSGVCETHGGRADR